MPAVASPKALVHQMGGFSWAPEVRSRVNRGRGTDRRAPDVAFRATGITAYLAKGGALEHAQEMAAHESPRTTKLYDRTKERLTQDEVERIRL
jgi:hypothetical protein